jgi:hypothetical protein
MDSRNTTVGVFSSRQLIREIEQGCISDGVQQLVNANRKAKTTLFFFAIQGINLNGSTIDGLCLDEAEQRWLYQTFSFPKVLYNRGVIPKRQEAKFEAFKVELAKQGAKHLNNIDGFNKWNLYKCLLQYDEIRPHLPKTKIYKSDKDLLSLLNTYPTLYLKAARGRKGYQVMRVARLLANRYEYRVFTKEDRVEMREVAPRELGRRIHRFFAGKQVLIQQAIDLPTIDNRIVDLRAEVQRNGRGELETPLICVRLSQENSPVTTHADAYPFTDFLGKRMNRSRREIFFLQRKIHKFLFDVYTASEACYGPMGEIGIDFALDNQNRLWFIECNSQPTKVSLRKAYNAATLEKAYLNPLEYAKYLVNTT